MKLSQNFDLKFVYGRCNGHYTKLKCKIDLKFIWDPDWSGYTESKKKIWLDFCMVTKMSIVEHATFINVTFMLLNFTFVVTFDNILLLKMVTFNVTTIVGEPDWGGRS